MSNYGSYHDASQYSLLPESAVRIAKEAPAIAVDIETAGLGPKAYQLKAISIADETSQRCVILNGADPNHKAAAVHAMIVAKSIIMHGASFDAPLLCHHGILSIDKIDCIIDTAVTARIAWPGFQSKRLGDLEEKLLDEGTKDRFKTMAKYHGHSMKNAFDTFSYDDSSYRMYAGRDAIITARIKPIVHTAAIDRLINHPFGRYGSDLDNAKHIIEREQCVNRLFLQRSARGLAIDSGMINNAMLDLEEKIDDAFKTMTDHGIRRITPAELIAVIEPYLPSGYPRTKKTNKPSTAAEFLELIDHPAAVAFITHKQSTRLMGYLEAARTIATYTNGRVQPQVNVMVAVTGRMSYGNPPLQQFPDDVRACICADDDDTLMSIDWKQAEIVVPANMAQDMKVLAPFEQGHSDMHQAIADLAGVARRDAKHSVFTELYGGGLWKLARRLGTDMPTAKKVKSSVRKAMPRTVGLIDKASELAKRHGCIFTLSGRIIPIDDKRFAYRAGNYICQGSQYDLLSEVLYTIYRRGMAREVYIALHDEIVASTRAAREIREIMETPPPRMIEICRRTPVLRVDSAELGRNWWSGDDKHQPRYT